MADPELVALVVLIFLGFLSEYSTNRFSQRQFRPGAHRVLIRKAFPTEIFYLSHKLLQLFYAAVDIVHGSRFGFRSGLFRRFCSRHRITVNDNP